MIREAVRFPRNITLSPGGSTNEALKDVFDRLLALPGRRVIGQHQERDGELVLVCEDGDLSDLLPQPYATGKIDPGSTVDQIRSACQGCGRDRHYLALTCRRGRPAHLGGNHQGAMDLRAGSSN